MRATLLDGGSIEYLPDIIGEGAMKRVHFSKDKKSVVCFFKHGEDVFRLQRLEAVLQRFNPLHGNHGAFWQDAFCWITGIVISPSLGVVSPVYPEHFYFKTGNFKGKEKDGTWFFGKKTRSLLPKKELGNWLNYFIICIRLARSIRRLHQAGLAHSDLSPKNVLADPTSGHCTVIDIDSLVVPGIFPPDVLGTRNYIAPEVIKTAHLPFTDPARKLPCITTDLHALATLIYQYLFLRHPLQGPKIHAASTAEEQEMLEMGQGALFIEHPHDRSNMQKNLLFPCSAMGKALYGLFHRAFVDGLHNPASRPSAAEWEKALYKTFDKLVPCENPACHNGWFVLECGMTPYCPVCTCRLRGTYPLLTLHIERKQGQWVQDGKLAIYGNERQSQSLYPWHVRSGQPRAEGADTTEQGCFFQYQNRWLLKNMALNSLRSAGGNLVPRDAHIELKDGEQFVFSTEQGGRMASVSLIRFV